MRIAPVVSVLLLAVSLACATAPGGAPSRKASPKTSGTHFMLFGEVAHPVPLAETDPDVRELYEDITDFLAIRTEDVAAEGFDAAALGLWVQGAVGMAKELVDEIEILAEDGDSHHRLLRHVGKGAILEHLAGLVADLPSPPNLNPDAEQIYREALLERAGDVAVRARRAYQTCAEHAEVPWSRICAERRLGLEGLAQKGPPTIDRAVADPRPTEIPLGAVPDGCGDASHTHHFRDPSAPRPDYAVPPVVAVIAGRLPLEEPDREALLEAIRAPVAAHTGLPLLSRDEVRRAETLVAARKWREDGPTCGQAPPLPAVLALSHPHVVMARAQSGTRSVGSTGGSREGESDEDWMRRQRFETILEVVFARAGHAGEQPAGVPAIPETLAASVRHPRISESWTLAAADLEPWSTLAPRMGALMGRIGTGGVPYLHVGEAEGTDPWLRVGRTLSGDLRDTLATCHVGSGVVAFDVAWRISSAGEATEVVVSHRAGPDTAGHAASIDEAVETARACIAQAIEEAGWPCPRDGSPAAAEVTLCIGHAPVVR